MSAEEDDTFDIDIYGDDEQIAPEADYGEEHNEEQIDFEEISGEHPGYDGANDADVNGASHVQSSIEEVGQVNNQATPPDAQTQAVDRPGSNDPVTAKSNAQPQQGTKRKAPSEELEVEGHDQHRPRTSASLSDPQATSALKFSELNWWTTEEDLRRFCHLAGVEASIRDLAFSEHKINGKSRGEAYIEFSSADAASRTKSEVEKANHASETAAPGKRVILGIHYSTVSNPFKTGPTNSSGVAKGGAQYTSSGRGGRDGAYERNSYGGGGNRGGRGGWSQNRGGGSGFNNNNRMNQPQQNQGAWNGMGGGMMNGAGMGGFGGNPMMMNMFQNMGRGGMMPNMGRGGYGMGTGMGNVGMGMGMNQRGGGMMPGMNMGMPGRGGWNSGYQGLYN